MDEKDSQSVELFETKDQETTAVRAAKDIMAFTKGTEIAASRSLKIGDKTLHLETDGLGKTEAHFINDQNEVIETHTAKSRLDVEA